MGRRFESFRAHHIKRAPLGALFIWCSWTGKKLLGSLGQQSCPDAKRPVGVKIRNKRIFILSFPDALSETQLSLVKTYLSNYNKLSFNPLGALFIWCSWTGKKLLGSLGQQSCPDAQAPQRGKNTPQAFFYLTLPGVRIFI